MLDVANNRIPNEALEELRKGSWKRMVRLDVSNYQGLGSGNTLNMFGMQRLLKNDFPCLFTIYLSKFVVIEMETSRCRVRRSSCE